MIEMGFLRTVFGLDVPLLRRRRLRYGIERMPREQLADAARRHKVERVALQLRELGYGGLAQLLEMSERRKDSGRNAASRRTHHTKEAR